MKGLHVKYEVRKKSNGELVEEYFVLRPDKDPAAALALLTYADKTDNKQLSEDIMNWLDSIRGAKNLYVMDWESHCDYVIATSKSECMEYYRSNITEEFVQEEWNQYKDYYPEKTYELFIEEKVKALPITEYLHDEDGGKQKVIEILLSTTNSPQFIGGTEA